jgi:hypothetical protein
VRVRIRIRIRAPLPRSSTDEAVEGPRERCSVTETALARDVGERDVGKREQLLRAFMRRSMSRALFQGDPVTRAPGISPAGMRGLASVIEGRPSSFA